MNKLLLFIPLVFIIILIVFLYIKKYIKCNQCKNLNNYEYLSIENTPKIFSDFRAPKNIFQTWETEESIPPSCLPVINKIKENNPDWNYIFYSAKDRRNLVEKFGYDTLKVYDNAINKAQQSDIFRYCVLYTYGGLYLDIKASVLGDLNYLQDKLNGKLLYCKWPKKLGPCDYKHHAATSILMWPAKHPILYTLINIITQRMLYNRKNCTTCICGPNIYAMVITKYIPKKYIYFSNNYVDGFFEHDGTHGKYYDYVKERKLHWSQNT
jgi:hypothetical protein